MRRLAMVAVPILALPMPASLQAMAACAAARAEPAPAPCVEARGVTSAVAFSRVASRPMAEASPRPTAPSLTPPPGPPAAVRGSGQPAGSSRQGAACPTTTVRPPAVAVARRTSVVTPCAMGVRLEQAATPCLLPRSRMGNGRLAAITAPAGAAPTAPSIASAVAAPGRAPVPLGVFLRRPAPRVAPLPPATVIAAAARPGSAGAGTVPAPMATTITSEAIVGVLTARRHTATTISRERGV